MEKNKRILITLLVLAAIVIVFMLGRSERLVLEKSGARLIMGTLAEITVITPDRQSARRGIAEAFKQMELVQTLMNDRDENSELSRLNKTASDRLVKVSPELFDVLWAAKEISMLTGGAFDVTIGPEVELWRKMQQEGVKPTPEQIEDASFRVGYHRLILNPELRSVEFELAGMKLDLGGIAKGYAIDLAVEALKKEGAVGGMVDIGGDIRCFGAGPGGKSWIVGVQDPRQEQGLIARLKLSEMAVATSGDYRRFAEVEGRRESHILHPATGQSVTELISVTVLAPTAMKADALATAVSVMGKERGLELIESLEGVEAILVAAEEPDELITTSGADAHTLD